MASPSILNPNNGGTGGKAQTSTLVAPGAGEITTEHRAVYVSVGGQIVGQLTNDTADRTFTVYDGQTLDWEFKYIKAGTTATLFLLD